MFTRCAILFVAVVLSGCGQRGTDKASSLAKKQAQVVERGRSVMPFDIDRSMHHFEKTPSGGVQRVVSTDRDPQQISLIREHLKAEAERFARGDFSDPSTIHGPEMPGLKTLAAGAGRIDIRYAEIPGGAQISYDSVDSSVVSAIHRWFDAQLQEHGHHAMPM